MTRKLMMLAAGLLLTAGAARAQWVVSDPTNLAQSIVNSTKQVVEATKNGQTMLQSFQQTVKIYQQGKKYYDALKAVNGLVRNARKVQHCMLLVGEISDIYVSGYDLLGRADNALCQIRRVADDPLSAGRSCRELQNIVNPTDMSLTDKDRIDVVERVYGVLLKHRNLAQYYTRKHISVSLLRARERGNSERVLTLYGTDEQRYW